MIDRKTFKEMVIKNGSIPLNGGESFYSVVKINKKNFPDMGNGLVKQLKDEGKYNDYIGFISPQSKAPYSTTYLPIYGSSERYVTKWFTKTKEKAMEGDLRSREMCLLNRAND
jgi:hypothetical protein